MPLLKFAHRTREFGAGVAATDLSQVRQLRRRSLYFLVFWLLTLAAFAGPLRALIGLSFRHDYYAHILLVPLISFGLIFLERGKIFGSPQSSLRMGASLFVVALIVYAIAASHLLLLTEAGRLQWTVLSLVIFWWTAFVFCYGLPAFRAALFPLVFLLLMVPIPVFVLDKCIYVLQKGSAEVSYALFHLVHVPVFRQGFRFSLPGINLEVAKECSGIRSSLALFITSLIAGHLFLRSRWMRPWLTLSFLPIVIFTNSLRIVTLALLATYVDISFLTGNLHRHGGIAFFLMALALLALALRLMRKASAGYRAIQAD